MRNTVLLFRSFESAGVMLTASTQLGAICGFAFVATFCRRSSQALLGAALAALIDFSEDARPSVSASWALTDDAATATIVNAMHRLNMLIGTHIILTRSELQAMCHLKYSGEHAVDDKADHDSDQDDDNRRY